MGTALWLLEVCLILAKVFAVDPVAAWSWWWVLAPAGFMAAFWPVALICVLLASKTREQEATQ